MEPDYLKCLSVQQPWASMLVRSYDRKDVENRTWFTTHRGPLLIHASKTFDKVSARGLVGDGLLGTADSAGFPLGSIIGCVKLFACTRRISSSWHADGQWGWYMHAAAVCFDTPVPWKGQLRLFEVPYSNVKSLELDDFVRQFADV